MAGSRCEKKLLAEVSSFVIRAMSSSVSWKSKMFKFSTMRSLRTGLASDTTPRWTSQRNTIWPTDLPHLAPARASVTTRQIVACRRLPAPIGGRENQ
jgi:hypothetical protein